MYILDEEVVLTKDKDNVVLSIENNDLMISYYEMSKLIFNISTTIINEPNTASNPVLELDKHYRSDNEIYKVSIWVDRVYIDAVNIHIGYNKIYSISNGRYRNIVSDEYESDPNTVITISIDTAIDLINNYL